MTNQTAEFEVVESFRFHFPARVIEHTQTHHRTLQARDGSKGFWRNATASELQLILGASSKARSLLLESKADE